MATTKKNINNKIYLVSFFVLVLAISIVVKLINIQFVDGDYYIELSEDTTIKNLVIPANRGNVYSSNGKLLASAGDDKTIKICIYKNKALINFSSIFISL